MPRDSVWVEKSMGGVVATLWTVDPQVFLPAALVDVGGRLPVRIHVL